MDVVKFFGRILPSHIALTFTDLPETDWRDALTGTSTHYAIKIANSQVEVTCTTEKFETLLIELLHKHSYDLVLAVVDLSAFSFGMQLTVVLEAIQLPDGSVAPPLRRNPELTALATSVKLPTVTAEDRVDFQNTLRLVISEPPLFMALHDLVNSLSVHHLMSIHCGRVVDSIRNMIAPNAADRDSSWEVLRTSLNVDKAYLRLIMEHSTPNRHGARTFVDGPTSVEILKRAWTIMNRFLEYRKRANTSLPSVEFPLLHG